MTVPTNDDPEIVLGGSDPTPSAPPAAASDLPTAIATPVAVSSPAATAPPLAAATTTSAGGTVERTTNADGSLTVKITTTRPQPNGYREVTTEHFQIPAGVVSTVALSLDQGDPPSSLYMTRMEQSVLPPETGAVMTRPPVYPTPGVSTPQAQQQPQQQEPGAPSVSDEERDADANRRMQSFVSVIVGFIALIAFVAYAATRNSEDSPSYTPPSPSWTPYPLPSPSWPYHSDPWSPYRTPSYPTTSPAPTSWWQKPADEWPDWSDTPAPVTPAPVTPAPAVSPQPTTRQEWKKKRKEDRKKEKGEMTSAPASPPVVGRAPSHSPVVALQTAPKSDPTNGKREHGGAAAEEEEVVPPKGQSGGIDIEVKK